MTLEPRTAFAALAITFAWGIVIGWLAALVADRRRRLDAQLRRSRRFLRGDVSRRQSTSVAESPDSVAPRLYLDPIDGRVKPYGDRATKGD